MLKEPSVLAVPPFMISLLILIFIEYPQITLDQHRITIEKKGLVKTLSLKDTYRFKDIKNVRYIAGHSLPEAFFILLFYRKGMFGPRTKADRIILDLKNGRTKIINRINSREKFIGLAQKLKEEVDTHNT